MGICHETLLWTLVYIIEMHVLLCLHCRKPRIRDISLAKPCIISRKELVQIMLSIKNLEKEVRELYLLVTMSVHSCSFQLFTCQGYELDG